PQGAAGRSVPAELSGRPPAENRAPAGALFLSRSRAGTAPVPGQHPALPATRSTAVPDPGPFALEGEEVEALPSDFGRAGRRAGKPVGGSARRRLPPCLGNLKPPSVA